MRRVYNDTIYAQIRPAAGQDRQAWDRIVAGLAETALQSASCVPAFLSKSSETRTPRRTSLQSDISVVGLFARVAGADRFFLIIPVASAPMPSSLMRRLY